MSIYIVYIKLWQLIINSKGGDDSVSIRRGKQLGVQRTASQSRKWVSEQGAEDVLVDAALSGTLLGRLELLIKILGSLLAFQELLSN